MTMNAALLHTLGEPPQYKQFKRPQKTDDQKIVKVTAAALKQLDMAIAKGTHYASPKDLPIICGTDGVGLLANGTRVYFNCGNAPFGAMAEYAPASLMVPIPEQLSDELVAALINPAFGAWLPLSWRAKMVEGETVLILGATGATGRQAISIAKILGAKKIIAAGRMRSGLATLDVDQIIDTEQSDEVLSAEFAEVVSNGVDIIVDYLWGKPAELLINELTTTSLDTSSKGSERGIRYVSVGALAGANISLPSGVLRSSFLHIMGSGTGNFPPQDQFISIIQEILQHAITGELTIEYKSIPLSEVENNWRISSKERLVFTP